MLNLKQGSRVRCCLEEGPWRLGPNSADMPGNACCCLARCALHLTTTNLSNGRDALDHERHQP
jgi:hypothetical protein